MSDKIKARPLTPEAFAKYGTVVTSQGNTPADKNENFAWFEKLGSFDDMSCVSVNVLRCKKREMYLDCLEWHAKTPEGIFPLGGEDVALAVAPAGDFDESKAEVFVVPAGKAVFLHPGVRHIIPYPLGQSDVDCAVVFRHGTGGDDLTMDQLKSPLKIQL